MRGHAGLESAKLSATATRNLLQRPRVPSGPVVSALLQPQRLPSHPIAAELMHLQRTAGNQAVAQLIKNGAGKIRPTPTTAVQREKVDLDADFQAKVDNAGDDKVKYQNFLEDFNRIQDLLFDEPLVKSYLKILSTSEAKEDLGAHLRKSEGAFSAAQPVLLASAGGAFTRIVNRGQTFVDTVATKHGVQTHRIQWNVIGQDIKARGGYHNSAVELYRESSREWWRRTHEGKRRQYVWERIIDGLGEKKDRMFTSPERLTDEIKEAGIFSGMYQLRAGLLASEDSRVELRDSCCKRYVESEHYVKGEPEVEVPLHHYEEVEGWTYTGFIKGIWREGSGGLKPIPQDRWFPTVAYPPGHDPDARPA